MKLIYVHYAGENYRGINSYEFLFTNVSLDKVDGEGWDVTPACGNPEAPLDFVTAAYRMDSEISFELIQDHESFDMYDCMNGIIPLAWEDNKEVSDGEIGSRMFFKFGESFENVESKIYSKDYYFQKVYDNEKTVERDTTSNP